MKATALKRKFDSINKSISNQIEKIYSLADEFEGEEVQEMLIEYADKLSDIVITDEDSGTTASTIVDYIENDLIPNEEEYNREYEEE